MRTEEINIQDTLLKRIEDEFYGCISLNEIVIGQAIEYIGRVRLENVTL